jgi:Fe-S-cluster-containing hydrogenase component 2
LLISLHQVFVEVNQLEKPKAHVNEILCLSCGGCVSICPKDAIQLKNLIAYVTKSKCNSCKICINTCPIGAISLMEG